MANPYYDHTTVPATGGSLSSSQMRVEFDLIEVGFDRLPILAGSASLPVFVNAGETGLEAVSASSARTKLGLGTMSTQAANNVAITGGSVSGITDLAVTDGGTGASSAANARTNLGLGSIATQAANNAAITGGTIKFVTETNPSQVSQTLTDNNTINWDMNNGAVATVTLGANNRLIASPTNLKTGTAILVVIQDANGNKAVTWNSAFQWADGTAPTLTATANAKDIISFFTDGTSLYGAIQKAFS